jgi:apolipoprotein N-acyltransferase
VFCVQPGVDQAFGDPKVQEALQARNIDLLLKEGEAHDPDLIVLPEGVDRLGDEAYPHPPFAIPNDVPIIFGAQRGSGPIYQSVFSFDGKTWTHADKTRLVIFGEYVPGRNLFGFLDNFHLASADIDPGKHVDPLTINFADNGKTIVGPLICYEGLFYDVAQAQAANGARLLTVVSIDDWFMGSPAPEQLEAAAVFRSVETNLPTVRSASTGFTMACDNKGNLLAELPIQKRGGMPVNVTVPLFAQPSWWLGDFPWISFLCALGLYGYGIAKRDVL